MDGLGGNPLYTNLSAGQRPPSVPGHTFHAGRYREPRAYWEWQDQQWSTPRTGEVTVMPPRPLPEGSE